VVNAEGCNDTLRLNLTINNGSLTEVTETACETFTWTAGNGTTYTASGVYDHIVVNTEGCNDTLRLNLTINNGSLTEVTETACETFTWTAGNGNDLYRFGRV
jgi:NifU-like protein involved in Fe-S cluster formation